jgi:hypothetical protein
MNTVASKRGKLKVNHSCPFSTPPANLPSRHPTSPPKSIHFFSFLPFRLNVPPRQSHTENVLQELGQLVKFDAPHLLSWLARCALKLLCSSAFLAWFKKFGSKAIGPASPEPVVPLCRAPIVWDTCWTRCGDARGESFGGLIDVVSCSCQS